jgi:hypothetical protein
VASASLQFTPLIGGLSQDLSLQRVSGDATSGVYTGTLDMPQGSIQGMWDYYLRMTDKIGNAVTLGTPSLSALFPGAGDLMIANTALTDQITIGREWVIDSGTVAVDFPAGTVITRQGGGPFAIYLMAAAPFVVDNSIPTTDLDGTPLATLELGIPGLDLSFDHPVSIGMLVGAAYNGYRLSIQSLPDGGLAWANETSCTVKNGCIIFTVNHATRFVANLTKASVPKPAITRLSSASGRRGAIVTITGKWFGAKRGTKVVRFGTRNATRYISWSATRIRCRVPTKATLGRLKVTVKTGSGTSGAKYFTVRR